MRDCRAQPKVRAAGMGGMCPGAQPKAVDGKGFLAALMEGDREIADRKKRSGHLKAFLGSKASRTASPTKIRSDSMIDMVKKAVRPSQGA